MKLRAETAGLFFESSSERVESYRLIEVEDLQELSELGIESSCLEWKRKSTKLSMKLLS